MKFCRATAFSGVVGSDLFFLYNIGTLHLKLLRKNPASFMRLRTIFKVAFRIAIRLHSSLSLRLPFNWSGFIFLAPTRDRIQELLLEPL
jgi:hypothetical protein